ncbi:MAG: HIT family protein [Thermoplasmata archaeon]|nr:HIT family protein [Thermoplasmata archaeon]
MARVADAEGGECLFCAIAARRLPGHIVYEDAETVAFLDLFPWTRGHTLIVPRQHVDRLKDLPVPERAPFLGAVAEMCRRIERLAPDYNIALNQGARAGQVVFHLHVHLIPRYGEANPFVGPHRTRLEETDALELTRILGPGGTE